MTAKRVCAVIAALFIVGFFSVTCLAERGVTKDTIKLGMIMVKTGPVAMLGLPYGNGHVDYFNYINDQGGVNGRKIELIWEDDEFKAPKSVAAFKKLIFRDKVLTIVTTGGTNQTIANYKFINKYKTCNIPNAHMQEFVTPFKPYIFSTGATYTTQYDCIIDYIFNDLKEKNPRIGVVYAKKEYGVGALKVIRERVKAYGKELTVELVMPTTAVDAGSQVLTLQEKKVDYVITTDVVPPIITFLKTAQKYNYKPKAVFGFNYSTDDLIVAACGEAAANYIGVNFVGAWSDNTPGIKLAHEIAEKYRGGKPGMKSYYVEGIGSASIFVEAFKLAGKDLTPQSLKTAFESIRDFDTGGIFAPITYTSKSHAPPGSVKFFKADVPNKCLVSITDWRKPRKLK